MGVGCVRLGHRILKQDLGYLDDVKTHARPSALFEDLWGPETRARRRLARGSKVCDIQGGGMGSGATRPWMSSQGPGRPGSEISKYQAQDGPGVHLTTCPPSAPPLGRLHLFPPWSEARHDGRVRTPDLSADKVPMYLNRQILCGVLCILCSQVVVRIPPLLRLPPGRFWVLGCCVGGRDGRVEDIIPQYMVSLGRFYPIPHSSVGERNRQMRCEGLMEPEPGW